VDRTRLAEKPRPERLEDAVGLNERSPEGLGSERVIAAWREVSSMGQVQHLDGLCGDRNGDAELMQCALDVRVQLGYAA
jgi:hypothetical protein